MSDGKQELRACPFCGKQPKITEQKAEKNGIWLDTVLIVCDNIDCHFRVKVGFLCPIEDVIKLWNTRVETRPQPEADWEKEFDEEFKDLMGRLSFTVNLPIRIKSFIRTLLARQSGVEITEEELKNIITAPDKHDTFIQRLKVVNIDDLAQAVMRKMKGNDGK